MGIVEIFLETVESLGSGVLGSMTSLGSLGLDEGSSLGVSISFSLGNNLLGLSSVWVESVHDGGVLEWVLLGLIVGSDGSSDVSELRLDLIGVDDSGKISTGHD